MILVNIIAHNLQLNIFINFGKILYFKYHSRFDVWLRASISKRKFLILVLVWIYLIKRWLRICPRICEGHCPSYQNNTWELHALWHWTYYYLYLSLTTGNQIMARFTQLQHVLETSKILNHNLLVIRWLIQWEDLSPQQDT
jgi:hypothetical protein